ncbi:MAG: hypothetical protein JW731_16030 [Bacteroidales bacterium]|nr:hypothetical protein [Bacteroidales bacterium]
MAKNLFYIICLLLISAKCAHVERIEGVRFSDAYNSCSDESYDFGEIITIGDPGDKFMISLPYEWVIQETYSDTLYGMIATNHYESRAQPETFMLISVTGYQTADSLMAYFKKEVNAFKKDRKMRIEEAGRITIKDQPGLWLKFKSKESGVDVMSVVVYLKNPEKDEIYLIQTSVYLSDNYMNKLCYLKRLVTSFEIVGLE